MTSTATIHITADGDYDTGISVGRPQTIVIYLRGQLGGGSLRVLSRAPDGDWAGLPNARYDDGATDAQGEPVEVIYVLAVGRVGLRVQGSSGAGMQVMVAALDEV